MALKTVLITGCSEGGLGAALAKAFQEQGYHVFATLRNPAKAGSLAGEHGTNVDVLPLDTTSQESIGACLETVRKKTDGKLEILVNNAGIGATMPMLHMPIDQAKEIYEVNVWGTLRLVQAFAPLLLESKGSIMNICSIVGAANVAWQGAYNSSKAAETMISESLRIELEPLGIRVLTVMLGQVSTQMYANSAIVHLPEGSPYNKIASTIATQNRGELNFNNEPAEVTARNLVRDAISGRSGKIWRGGLAGTVSLALWLLPTWLFEWIVHLKRGVYDL
ncbi:hypothetical protein N0V82_007262 [Gnomoniopsis sp. IMI 355080]|nr:hypothetical protein N0V82_007262 [Gnomoniopsis sp. IMI 355080]